MTEISNEVDQMIHELEAQERMYRKREEERLAKYMDEAAKRHKELMESRRGELIDAYHKLCEQQGVTPVENPDLDVINYTVEFNRSCSMELTKDMYYRIQESSQHFNESYEDMKARLDKQEAVKEYYSKRCTHKLVHYLYRYKPTSKLYIAYWIVDRSGKFVQFADKQTMEQPEEALKAFKRAIIPWYNY